MRVLLVVPFLLMAGASAQAQSFSFNVGGQPVLVDIRGPCAECITVIVPGYVQYSRRHYYDYEVPYGERRPSRARAAQSQKRKPQVAMARDPLPVRLPPTRHAPPPATDMTPAPAAPAALQPKPEITRVLPATPPVATPRVETPAVPPAAAVPAPEPVASPVVAAAPAAVSSPPPPSPAPEAVAPTLPVTPAPATPEIAAAPPLPAATPTPAARPAPEKKPAVIAALPPARQDVEQRAKPSAISPIGVWSSSEGQMRVEACGKNLCSYAVGGPKAGTMILKHMRPTGANQWSGQVTDIRSGQTYSAHMSLRGTNGLNIQGCALGGMVCGGRTLTRVR